MYTNFIYFIVVLLIFSTQQPPLTPPLSLILTLCSSLALLCLFALINRQVFRQLLARISGISSGQYLAVLYHRSVSRQSLLALLFFCFQVYLLDVKSHLISVPLIRASFTLQGLVALGLFLAATVAAYNRLVRSRERTREAWSGIDVQLTRRADLVPALVEVVRGYAAHELETLEQHLVTGAGRL